MVSVAIHSCADTCAVLSAGNGKRACAGDFERFAFNDINARAAYAAFNGVYAHKRKRYFTVVNNIERTEVIMVSQINSRVLECNVLRSRYRDGVSFGRSGNYVAVRVGRHDLISAAVIARYAGIGNLNAALTDVKHGLYAVALCQSRQTYNSADSDHRSRRHNCG